MAENLNRRPAESPFGYPIGNRSAAARDARQKYWCPFRDGIISLTAVCEGLVESALMVELDDDVAAVWEAVSTGVRAEVSQ